MYSCYFILFYFGLFMKVQDGDADATSASCALLLVCCCHLPSASVSELSSLVGWCWARGVRCGGGGGGKRATSAHLAARRSFQFETVY